MTRAGVATERALTEPDPRVREDRPPRRRATAAFVGFCVLLAVLAAWATVSWPADRGVEVTREELGPLWPLTVSAGALRCEYRGEITFQRGGTTYSLNRRLEHGANPDIGPIWAASPTGAKMDLSPLIERGTRLCE